MIKCYSTNDHIDVSVTKSKAGLEIPRVLLKNVISTKELARNVAAKAGRMGEAEVNYALTYVIEEIIERVKEGNKVVIQDLGTFQPRFHDNMLTVRFEPARTFINAMKVVMVKKHQRNKHDENCGVVIDEDFEREIEKFL